ncbi:MAG: hypothetical protein HQL97_14230, partial [Magnetococcales bacterium]|nr:hypothetical protein [Magnetococcales bacterium]
MMLCFPVNNVGIKLTSEHYLTFLATLLRWAEQYHLEGGLPVQLRIGLHLGPVSYIRDFNGELNCFGDAVNMASRVMNAADPGQILLHEDYIKR